MSATSSESMDSLVSSLIKSFTSVPCAAIPSILDCILTSTDVSSSSLFDSLLNAFSDLLKGICKQDHGKSSLVQSSYISSFTTSLCHLLKKSGTDTSGLQSFIWRGFLLAMKTINSNDHELLNLIAEQLSDVVIESNTWEVINVSLVPFLLCSVGLSIGVNRNEDSAQNQWSGYLTIQGLGGMQNGSCVDKESIPPLYDSFPLAISCHVLTSLLVASSRSHQTLQRPLDPMVLSGCSAEIFFQTLLWDVCAIAIQMLSKSPDSRFCTIHLLLPFILRTFACDSSFQISLHGQVHVLSRDSFSRNIWKGCLALFTLGPLERRDAYSVLSLYIYILYSKERRGDITLINGVEEFDIRAEQQFWDEIKKGLVAKEAFVRKQSLDILKTLSEHDERQCYTGRTEMNMHERSSISLDLTKKAQWADKEAKSLGVGQVCNVTDDNSSSCQQRWGAFILLYEMLEEYGTHLVEAAWNHQISMLLQFPFPQRSSWSNVYQSQLETLKGMFSWLAVLWERGLCHENPQVRGLIMQSFLSINWEDHGICTDLVPESFIIGPFLQGLNDTVHHREFGEFVSELLSFHLASTSQPLCCMN
ncbi:tRNA/rRNA methyltransferase (SpoU) family protein [Thalictrum thalictroides]|uniref:tRNA/rRNA methyltransferase (SpoU) family protein n=1 Tax=Thalictrum thalictroides TaxID=46969 RepID=A0A7J6UYX6_THATH|nr:tRNA/rRNA methyltransferase (SpoU) family protein [Thalictrum thalictroides]